MSSVGSVSQNGLNFTGLATGIDTSSIISGLTNIGQKRIDSLRTRQADIAVRQATFTALRGQLFDLQSKTAALARSAGGAFDGRKVSVSDETAVAAAAGTAAVPGTYQITVNSLAKAAQTASDGFLDPNAVLKTGTLSVQVGSGTAINVTVDSRNNTLQGLADSINVAGGDVRASVINDGSATPYRLLLTSNKTGAANAITVTNNLTTGTGADIDPLARTVQAATDAEVALGSGPGAVTLRSGSNVVNNLVPGVTLTLQSADPAKTISLSVANDTDAAVTAVKDFVSAFNAVKDFIADRSRFDAETGQAGILLGNGDVAELANQLSNAISTTIPGLGTNANRLSSVGLSFDNGGKLVLDEGKLTAALSGASGTAPADFKRLFALSGTSDNPGVAFSIGTNKTRPSGGSPYVVEVTAAATRAVVIATGPPNGTVVITPANNALQIKLNNLISLGISIDSGTYTLTDLAALASQIQLKINSQPETGTNLVSVALNGDGKFQITSQLFGSSAAIAVTGGSAAADLGFAGTESASGTNVAGRFLVGGVPEAATGAGQVLSGKAGNANTEGLQVRATVTSPDTANVTVSQGLASRLNSVLDKYLNANTGKLKSINDQFAAQTADLDKTITRQNDILKAKTDELTLRFAALESTVSNLKNVGASLTAMLGKSTSN
jgi:flagellar hook-associated protein 2